MSSSANTRSEVNISLGDRFSSYGRDVIRASDNNSPYVVVDPPGQHEHFRSPHSWQYQGLPEGCRHCSAADGVGTKVILHDAANTIDAAAWDLLAMTCDDIARYGGLPLLLSNVLEVRSLGESEDSPQFQRARLAVGMLGLTAASHQVVLATGETAEMGVVVGTENAKAVCPFNWTGVASGVYDPTRLITGAGLKQGDYVVALREYGFRSNGITDVRTAFWTNFGDDWANEPDAQVALKMAAAPSTPYAKLLTAANGWYNQGNGFTPLVPIKAIVHLTGGAFPSKLGHDLLFPRGLSAYLDGLYDLPDIMRLCADWLGWDDHKLYSKWNGGQGALIVMDGGDYPALSRLADSLEIELRYCGQIENAGANGPEIVIESRYHQHEKVVYRRDA